MVTHFFNDITHFDGKFVPTAGYLLARPGFLSKEYVSGRRQRYLHPVRMYVFTSALFFLLFFAFGFKGFNINGGNAIKVETAQARQYADSLRHAINTSLAEEKLHASNNEVAQANAANEAGMDTSLSTENEFFDK